MLAYLSHEAGAELQPFWTLDPESAEMKRMDEQSLKAQELYSYFWSNSQ